MHAGGLRRDEQLRRDLPVAAARGQQAEHLGLACGEAVQHVHLAARPFLVAGQPPAAAERGQRGEYSPSLYLALRIAEYFEVPVEVIFSVKPFPRIGTDAGRSAS